MPKLIRKGQLGLSTLGLDQNQIINNFNRNRKLIPNQNSLYLEDVLNPVPLQTIYPTIYSTNTSSTLYDQSNQFTNIGNTESLIDLKGGMQFDENSLNKSVTAPTKLKQQTETISIYSPTLKKNIDVNSEEYQHFQDLNEDDPVLNEGALDRKRALQSLRDNTSKPQVVNTSTKPPSDIKLDDIAFKVIEKSRSNNSKSENSIKNFDGLNAAADAANQIMTGIVGDKMYGGPKGHLTQAIDQGWDTAANVASEFGPVGEKIGLIMKGMNVFNKGVSAALGSKALDNMTTTDAVLNNPLLGWNVGLINALGGKAADTITKNEDVFAQVGSAYGGSNSIVDNSLEFSGKRYGAFSSGARKDANALIAESRRQQNMLEDISDEASTRQDLTAYMSAINSNRRALAMQGGYNQSAIHFGRNGFSFKTIAKTKKVFDLLNQLKVDNIQTNELKEIFLPSEIQEVKLPEFKLGGIIEKSLDDIPIEHTVSKIKLEQLISEFKEGGTIESKELENKESQEYTPEDPESIIKFVNKHKKVNFVQRLRDSFRETIPDWEVEGNVSTHKLGYVEDRDKIKVFPFIQEIDGELHDFTNPEYNHGKWDALESAERNRDVIIFDNKDDAEWFTKHYKEYYPTFNKYKEGGKFNVIPEGALHARLHHMEDDENITKKGIPVVSEDEHGNIEQQAEIEQNEIIYRLEVTQKLEELQKKYYSDDYSEKEKDNFAIEAGKLLVYETLYNTIDNTGLLNGNT